MFLKISQNSQKNTRLWPATEQLRAKSVQIRSFSGPYFPVFGLNMEIYGVQIRENTDQKNSVFGQFLRSESYETKSYEILEKLLSLRYLKVH